jgi:hypothetical protein
MFSASEISYNVFQISSFKSLGTANQFSPSLVAAVAYLKSVKSSYGDQYTSLTSAAALGPALGPALPPPLFAAAAAYF